MVSDKPPTAKSSLTTTTTTTDGAPKPLTKEEAMRKLQRERQWLKIERAEWTDTRTPFDHLPAHEKPFPIEPFPHERQRLPFRMSDEDRARRQRWVESQQLVDSEPRYVPELETMLYNPIRRLYRAPADRIFAALGPVIGSNRATFCRYVVPKLVMGWLAGCALWYHVKYNRQDWQSRGGWQVVVARPPLLPEDPKPSTPNKWDYHDRGFQSRSTHKGSEYGY